MKTYLLSLLISLVPLLVKAQIHTSLDVIGGINLINEVSCCSQTIALGRDGEGYRFGVNFNVRLFEKSFLKTGMRYVKMSFLSAATLNDFIDEYYYEVPILIRYEFNDYSVSPYFEVGVSPHIVGKSKLVDGTTGNTLVEDLEIEYLEGKRFRMTTNLAFGLNFKLSKDYQLFTQGTIRYFRPIETSFSFSRFSIINVGLEVGVRKAISFVGNEWDL